MSKTFDVQVTNWLTTRLDAEFTVREFLRQKLSFAVAHKNGGWSVWRESRMDDPQEIILPQTPEDWEEVYVNGVAVDPGNFEPRKKVA